ncbi:MAG: hypothetical protein V4524_02605 [Patescibacteria group bacterium]
MARKIVADVPETPVVNSSKITRMVNRIVDEAPIAGSYLSVSLRRGDEKMNTLVNGNTIDGAKQAVRVFVQEGWVPA